MPDNGRELADVGELHAPKIAGESLGLPLNQEEDSLPSTNPLGGVALIIFFLNTSSTSIHILPRIQWEKKMMIC